MSWILPLRDCTKLDALRDVVPTGIDRAADDDDGADETNARAINLVGTTSLYRFLWGAQTPPRSMSMVDYLIRVVVPFARVKKIIKCTFRPPVTTIEATDRFFPPPSCPSPLAVIIARRVIFSFLGTAVARGKGSFTVKNTVLRFPSPPPFASPSLRPLARAPRCDRLDSRRRRPFFLVFFFSTRDDARRVHHDETSAPPLKRACRDGVS